MCVEQFLIKYAPLFVAVMQFILACLLGWIGHKQGQSSKILPLLTDYGRLSKARWIFWQYLNSRFLAELSNADILPVPVPLPSDDENLFDYVQTHNQEWDQKEILIWCFAKKVCSGDQVFDEARAELAYFWDRCAKLLKTKHIRKYFSPDWKELVLLTWIELAIIQNLPGASERPGKTALFRLANAECERAEQQLSS